MRFASGLVLAVLANSAAGCTCGERPVAVGEACHVIASSPDVDGAGVGIVGSLHVTWSESVSPESVQAALTLHVVGGDAVPIMIETVGDTATITPEHSLHFWTSYSVDIGPGVQSTKGAPCDANAIPFATVAPKPEPRTLRPASIRGLAVVGSYALAASPGYRGLQIYDISDERAPSLVGELLTDHEPLSLVVAGDRAYAPAGFDGVMIFDVSNPAAPKLLGRGGTPGFAADVAPFTRGGRLDLAVADGVEGVRLLDVTDPAGVKDLGAIDPSGQGAADVQAVDIQGDELAIADGQHGMSIASIADLAHPVLLSSLTSVAPAVDVMLDAGVLYVSRGFYGIRSFDVTNPAAPTQIAEMFGPHGPCTESCVDDLVPLVRDGDSLFTAAGRTGAVRVQLDGVGGMALMASLPVGGQGYVAAPAGSALLVGTEGGLLSFDRAAPDGSAPLSSSDVGHGVVRAVAIVGDHAYAAASTRGLQTFAITDGAPPTLIDRDDSPGASTADIAAFNALAAEGFVVLGDGRAGVTLYDTSDATNPIERGSVPAMDRIAGMDRVGSTVYACDDNAGLMIIDITSLAAPVLLARLPFVVGDQCLDVKARDGLLFVAGGTHLSVVDVSDPNNPTWKGEFVMPAGDSVGSLAFAGSELLGTTSVADYEGTFGRSHRLQVFDLSDPAHPGLAWASDDLGGASTVTVVGDVAFVAAGDLGIHVFDISDPFAPLFEGTIDTPGNSMSVASTASALYVAEGAGGLQRIRTGPLPTDHP